MWQIRGEASIGVSGYANASHLFEGPASTSLSWYTNASPLFFTFSYKYFPPPLLQFLEKYIEKKGENCMRKIGKSRDKKWKIPKYLMFKKNKTLHPIPSIIVIIFAYIYIYIYI